MADAASWNAERVLALAPDAASAPAGRGLAAPSKWANLGQADNLVWGECQGSGSKPYRCQVAPDDPAFKCSCPSRKFPCKHAIGLLLIWSGPGATVGSGEPPAWAAEWAEARAQRAEAKQQKAEKAEAAPVDPAARQKREAGRLAKVAAGLDDLDRWLGDLARSGLAALASRPGNPWDEQARRLVDAQCPGVARRLREVDALPKAGDGWQAAVLDRLGRVYLLIEAFRRRDRLSEAVREDVRAAIGFPADLDGVRAGTAGAAVRDAWQVLGQAFGLEEKIAVRRTWLRGRDSGRSALVLDFAAPGRPFDVHFEPGTAVDATLGFLPGAAMLRAVPLDRHGAAVPVVTLDGGGSVAEAHAAFGAALARSPWVELVPVVLADATLWPHDGGWSVVDATGHALPIHGRFDRGWEVEALTGGLPLTLAGEFDGAALHPVGAARDGRYLALAAPGDSGTDVPPASRPPDSALLRATTAAAIVGVDRRPPPAAGDDRLGRALASLDDRPAPARLFALAAAGGLYARAGRLPSSGAEWHRPPPDLADDRPEASPAAAALLARLLRGELGASAAHDPALFLEWFDRCAAAGRRLPAPFLVPVLTAFQGRPDDAPGIGPILGRRGAWLAARNPKWAPLAGAADVADADAAWATGARAERLALLDRLRRDDPAAARRLVAATFAAEPAALRAEILARFAVGLGPDDEPLLEGALDDRGKDVRAAAAELLARLPGSRLAARMADRMRAILARDGDRVAVAPPRGADAALTRDGVAAEPPKDPRGRALGVAAYHLREVLGRTPLGAVVEHLGRPPAELIRAVAGSDWAEGVVLAWEVAAARQGDLAWARALVLARAEARTTHQSPHFDALFAALPGDDRDALIAERLGRLASFGSTDRAANEANRFLAAARGTFGVALARALLGRLIAEVAEGANTAEDDAALWGRWAALRNVIDLLDGRLPFELVDETVALAAARLGPLAAAAHPAHSPSARLEALLGRWAFRRDLHQEFAPR